MKSAINLAFDNLVLRYYETEFKCIESYFEKLSAAVESERERIKSLADCLKSKGAPDDYIADSLDEDSFYMDFFKATTYNFAAVFLFSECEKLLKTDYHILTYKNARRFFKFDEAKTSFKEVGVDLTRITNYQTLNELRFLNNCIKHDGYPDENLCKYNQARWKKDKKLS